MPNNSREKKLEAFGRLLDVMDTLRERCPWDSVQTNESLRPNTIEETMELAEAIIADDNANIRKELGDVLLHIVFYAKIGDEKGLFDIADVCNAICDKLIFRHPHIYGSEHYETAREVLDHWELIKMRRRTATRPCWAACQPPYPRSSRPSACRRRPPMWASTGNTAKMCGLR